ncbi:unnamed protein product [Acanthoscelides obtectus]|uniref:Uncharacterized protein n=1 Tax=Acanthoscelides obtectus TaxID=200917 RepID=A0A9P0MCJ0_ACAOB|nr:unnamed protein product [Acanthoscelides obtectus]CAK1658391.1 hypothetical protein AOBTE_LOCUS20854 [Acanthoscelides obtectus]
MRNIYVGIVTCCQIVWCLSLTTISGW